MSFTVRGIVPANALQILVARTNLTERDSNTAVFEQKARPSKSNRSNLSVTNWA
jgi:hypothetical protein